MQHVDLRRRLDRLILLHSVLALHQAHDLGFLDDVLHFLRRERLRVKDLACVDREVGVRPRIDNFSTLTIDMFRQIAELLRFNHLAKLALADHLIVKDNIAANLSDLRLGQLDFSGRVGR